MEDSIFEGLRRGEIDAIIRAEASLENGGYSQTNIQKTWIALVEGVLKAPNPRPLLEFSERLGDFKQDPVIAKMYEDLVFVSVYPSSSVASVSAISIGASVARIAKGEAPARLDDKAYIRLAKAVLLKAMESGHDETKRYIAEVMANIPDGEVKSALISMVKKSQNDELAEAAGGSLGRIRNSGEIQAVQRDRRIMLNNEYPDLSDPRRMYLEGLLNAAELVLSAKRNATKGTEYRIAVKQLATPMPEAIEELFEAKRDRENLAYLTRNIENALLHAIIHSEDSNARIDSALGLICIGSDRVEQVLENMVKRHGERLETGGKLAAETLAQIRGNKVELIDVKPIPKPPKKDDPKRQKRLETH